MTIAILVLSWLSVSVWALLSLALRWRASEVPVLRLDEPLPAEPLVSVIIPARNEAELLPGCLSSVVGQSYKALQVIVVDDHSTDDTRRIAQSFPQVTVVDPGPRPVGWAGKCWAAEQGAKQARGHWLLFLDADAVMDPDCLAASVREAEREQLDLLSLLPRVHCGTAWEQIIQPLMFGLTVTLGPPRRVNDPASTAAAAAGSYLLFRQSTYLKLGGHQAVRNETVEDLKLAQLVKSSGRRLRLLFGQHWVMTRRPETLVRLWHAWCRVAGDGLGRRPLLGLAGALAIIFLFLLPPLAAPLSRLAFAAAVSHALLGRYARARLAAIYHMQDSLAWLQPLGALFALAVVLRVTLAQLGLSMQTRWHGRTNPA